MARLRTITKGGLPAHILVLNGSPKGKYSATLQTSLYLELLRPEHTFEYLNAASLIRRFEKDFSEAAEALLRADHKFYKAHGQYDFPQKKAGTMLAMYGAGYLFSNKKLKAKLGGKLNEGMLSSYTKVLEQARKKRDGGENKK